MSCCVCFELEGHEMLVASRRGVFLAHVQMISFASAFILFRMVTTCTFHLVVRASASTEIMLQCKPVDAFMRLQLSFKSFVKSTWQSLQCRTLVGPSPRSLWKAYAGEDCYASFAGRRRCSQQCPLFGAHDSSMPLSVFLCSLAGSYAAGTADPLLAFGFLRPDVASNVWLVRTSAYKQSR